MTAGFVTKSGLASFSLPYACPLNMHDFLWLDAFIYFYTAFLDLTITAVGHEPIYYFFSNGKNY
ncbi:hypothetical protein BpHYR1_030612 [Brachionus plicatilis]|uniref:Uncharacterized protein n=1 Tax=Brachionus plicatilis TaxID=10195 RepID=A0A3M7Q3E6_BRAPC|nr:hypothetical protein BpHYR1_030612 [Brachionus plicatilis]